MSQPATSLMPSAWEDDDCTVISTRGEITAAVAQASAQRPWLVIVSGTAGIGKMVRLEGGIVIGRAAGSDVCIDEDGVSRSHARVTPLPDGRVELCDLGSRNGTYVNGVKVTRTVLGDGDKIQIGTCAILKLSYQDALDEELQRNLYDSATRDPLTRALNRRAFSEALAREHAFAKRHGRPLSVIVCDLDFFKRINDQYGHPAGDRVLRRIGEIVGAAMRAEDVFARIGGEEFAVLLRDVPLAGARDCAERLRRLVAATAIEHEGLRMPVTLSLGVATLDLAEHVDGTALLAAADRKLYEAKHAGRNRVAG